MNAPLQTSAPPPDASLDAQIRAVELRLIAREESLRRRVATIGTRVRHALTPRRLAAPVLGAVAAGVALWWGLRTLRRASPGFDAAVASPRRGGLPAGLAGLPWASLLGFARPMLPVRWRSRVSPATATTVITVALPLLQKVLAGHPGGEAPLHTMPVVDLARYAGTWHEIARLPAPFEGPCLGQPTATYVPTGGTIEVVNRCTTAKGVTESRGEARPVPGSGGAKLEVSLWPAWTRVLPFAWAKYWILHVDDDYSEALVGHPNRRFLWVLSRSPTLAPQRLEALVNLAAARGFPVERLKIVQPR